MTKSRFESSARFCAIASLIGVVALPLGVACFQPGSPLNSLVAQLGLSRGDDDDGPNDDDDGPGVPRILPTTVPSFRSSNFSDPANVTNPLFPLTPGRTLTYGALDGSEEIILEVLLGTREVAGLECRVVRDRVYKEGVLVEDTFDWYAQDDNGNVWYMGEEVTDFNYDDEGQLVDVVHAGAWESGRDVADAGILAVPGYIMLAAPTTGAKYHQEYYRGVAEDTGEIISTGVLVTLADGSEYSCVQTLDASSLDPSIQGYKFYAEGAGVVLETALDGGERVELRSDTIGPSNPVPLKEAKLIIEHNATDEDTGFQGFIDSDGWQRLDVVGPNGPVLAFQGRGSLADFGLTELFFETVEPPNSEVPIEDILAKLPEGEYTIAGPTPDGGRTTGTARLTHKIPAGPALLTPGAGAVVSPNGLVMSWSAVTQTIFGQPVNIIRYQLIVQEDVSPRPRSIGKLGLSIYVPSTVTSITVPNEMLKPGTRYKWEVLAIEEGGNQTLSSSEFSTQ